MGILLRWRIPDTDEVTYDYVIVYRSTSESGTYSLVATQLITDNTYFDSDGSSTSWYKVRFRGGDDGSYFYSDYSGTMQGGKYRGYCSPDDIRTIANLTSDDITDSRLYDIITFAMTQLNHEINSKIIEEPVSEIDSTRTNKIDSSNTTFYVQKSFDWFIADMDDDGDVDTSDIIVYKYDSEGVRTEPAISSITPNEGKFVLTTAPESGSTLKVTYSYASVSESDPHPLLKICCAHLAASLAFTRIETGYFERLQIGKLTLQNTSRGFTQYYDLYRRGIHLLQSRMVRKTNDPDFWFAELEKTKGTMGRLRG